MNEKDMFPPRTRQQVWAEMGGSGDAPSDADLESQGLPPIGRYPNLVAVEETKADQLARLTACVVAAKTQRTIAEQSYADASRARLAWLEKNPPTSFRLQEAYQNKDGTFSTPHWDEVLGYATHNAIDQEEVLWAICHVGEWYEVFHNPDDDPRPGYRRIIEVTW